MLITIDTKWLDAISFLDEEMRLVMLDAIFAYMQGREPILILESERIFNTIKPFLDEIRNKRERLAERSRANGMKGGRKKKKNLAEAEPRKPNGFVSYLEKEEFQGRCENLLALDKWKEENTPYIYANIRPLTQKEFATLVKRYTSSQICDTLRQIENRKDLRKRYTDPYRTLLNWLKNNYGNT